MDTMLGVFVLLMLIGQALGGRAHELRSAANVAPARNATQALESRLKCASALTHPQIKFIKFELS
jgi:hypothetical protein